MIQASRSQYPISKKLILKKTVLFAVLVAFVTGGIYFLTLLTPGQFNFFSYSLDQWFPKLAHVALFHAGWWTILFFTCLALILALPYQFFYYQSYEYDFSEDHVHIKKGVLNITQLTIPYERMQDVYIYQTFFDRLFGLYSLIFNTATYMPSKGRISSSIEGLEKATADTLYTLTANQIKLKTKK